MEIIQQQREIEMRYLPAISICGYVGGTSQYMVMWAVVFVLDFPSALDLSVGKLFF